MAAAKRTRTRAAKPKAPQVIRVTVNAPPVSKPEAVATLAHKLAALATDNPTVIVSPPYLAQLSAAANALSTAIIAAQGGSDATQTALVTATVTARSAIKAHGAWVEATAAAMTPTAAVTFITTGGFLPAKSPHRTPISQPEFTSGHGVIHCAFPSLAGYVMWFTEVSTDGGHTWTRTTDTEHVKCDITGLTLPPDRPT